MELVTALEMRALEAGAIGSGAVTGLALMERAGRAVVAAILAEWPDLVGPHRAVVLCGPGNNGGDGFVVARLLAARGWVVSLRLLGAEARLPPDAAEMCRRWRAAGGAVLPAGAPVPEPPPDLLVDALFGTGLARPLGPEALALLHAHLRSGPRPRIVSVDCASGLCIDSGRWLGDLRPDLAPDLTVTFHRAKPGHFLAEGAGPGRLVVADIGLGGTGGAGRLRLAGPPAGLGKRDGHKYDHGHVLVLGGGPGRGGAARLAARGALRIGAGLVTLGCPPAALIENAARLDAVMLRPVADAAALGALLADARLNALCLGPGLGAARARALVPAALAARRATVLDADALTAFAGDPSTLLAALHAGCVLTPHMGEFARLFPDLAARLRAPATRGPAFSKVDAAREAAARAGCVLLLKGPDTVIADPEGRAVISAALRARAAPWLATAGAGDVLAGFIAGLLARGLAPMAAAEAAAWLHVECARRFGPGLVAEDLPETLPAVLRALGA